MRKIWAALLLLPAFAWGASFDPSSFDRTNSFDPSSFSFPAVGACDSNDLSPIPGTTINITGCPAFAGTITTLTGPGGDTITAEAGASTTAADFIIPATTAFVFGQSHQDTEWALSGTWTVGDGSTTENITLTIDPPGTTGPDHFFGTVVGPEAGDSVFPPAAAAESGDEYYVFRVTGTSVQVNANGSTSAATDYSVTAQIWDESANGAVGQWSALESTTFDATSPLLVSSAIDATGLLFTPTFDEAVNQGAGYADSDLTLSCSGGAATLAYSVGDGTTTPDYVISRTIEGAETCTIAFDGSSNSLEDAVGNDVASFSGESVTNNASGDTIPPAYSSSAFNTAGTAITITLNEATVFGAGGNTGFAIASCSGGAVTPTYSSGSGSTALVYTLSRAILSGETGCTVAHTQVGNGAEDSAGNDVITFGAQAITNSSTNVAPTYSSSAINTAGTEITVTLTESVDFGAGGNGGFALDFSGGVVTPTYSSGSGSTALVYTLSRTIQAGETGTVEYTQVGNGIEDLTFVDLATFPVQSVTNNSTADTIAPLFDTASIPSAGTSIWLIFDEAVEFGAGGNGGFAIASCSGGSVTPTYSSGSASDTLIYTLSRTIGSHETGCTVAYTQPTNGVEDAAANDLASFTAQAVTNGSTADSVVPTFVFARINAVVLTLNYSEVVIFGAGGNGGNALTCSGGAVTPTYVSGSGSAQLSYSLSRNVAADETCTLDYVQPTAGITDTSANELASFSDESVTILTGATTNCPNVTPSPIKQSIKEPLRLPLCA